LFRKDRPFQVSGHANPWIIKRSLAMGWAFAEREAESDGPQKKASTDTRLSDVGISYDQSSRW
jgi:hypothetical protein